MAVPDLRPAQAATDERPHRHREPVWRPRPTLTGTDYTTQAVFDQERERVLVRRLGLRRAVVWDLIAGDYIVRDIVGESIVVNRDLAGRPRAFYNVCAHRGTQLVDPAPDCGHVNKVFKCPYHAWSYDLEGRLVGTPNVHEDEQFERGDHPLHAIAADEYGGFVFVSLAAEPQPLVVSLKASVETITDFERYRMDELRLGARIVYEVKANWKTVVENYNECLHCPTVHPNRWRSSRCIDRAKCGTARRATAATRCATTPPASASPARPTCRASRTCCRRTTACITAPSSSRT